MATLQYSDLAKRDNFNVLANRINGEGGFQLDDQKSPVYKATGKVIITKKINQRCLMEMLVLVHYRCL